MIEYEISDSERIFLKSQNISVYELFNAKGRPIPQCKQEMENHGKLFAYNTTASMHLSHLLLLRQAFPKEP